MNWNKLEMLCCCSSWLLEEDGAAVFQVADEVQNGGAYAAIRNIR